jgi:hypothetical protein
MPADENDPLRGKLEQVEHRLQAALGEVCEDNSGTSVRKPDTGELIKIDETLALAQEAAKQAIALRRRMRSDARKGGRADDDARPSERAE